MFYIIIPIVLVVAIASGIFVSLRADKKLSSDK